MNDMEKIPTAEEMFEANPILPPGVQRQACIAFMKKYAKLHVEEALKIVLNEMKKTYNHHDSMVPYITDDLGLKFYPLENIK
jgi:hypothetical protein